MPEIKAIFEAYNTGGLLVALGTVIMIVVKLWSTGKLQGVMVRFRFPAWMLWGNLSPFGKLVSVFVLTGIGGALVSYVVGVGWVKMLEWGLAAGVAAVGSNEIWEKVTKKVKGDYKPASGGLIAKDPDNILQAPVIKSDDA